MKMDIIDALTLSASRYIIEAERTGDPAWAKVLYGLAEMYIDELSKIAGTQPTSISKAVFSETMP